MSGSIGEFEKRGVNVPGPDLGDVLGALDFEMAEDYPASAEIEFLAQAAECVCHPHDGAKFAPSCGSTLLFQDSEFKHHPWR